jgi:hypothetical protein
VQQIVHMLFQREPRDVIVRLLGEACADQTT